MTNKVKYLIILSACVMAGYNTSLAGERTEREMLSIAQAKLTGGNATRSVSNITLQEENVLYNVYGNERSFVIVSRDDTFTPVLAYADSKYDPTQKPCGLTWWMDRISLSMENRQARSITSGEVSAIYDAVEPLCKTKWGQGDPYNFMCPTFDGTKAPTGCVATAMSQIMKYFNYPVQGKGKGYYQKGGNAGRVTEPTTSVYQWEKMLDTYKGVDNLTDEDRVPVATLMKEAGLASFMNYDEGGSGAYSTSAAYGFCNNFSYDSLAMHCYYREYFDEAVWMDMIYSELSAHRPILYTGVDNAVGGHAFVFDGFDADGLIHVNWGWDGLGNGYFDIADLAPVTNPRIGPKDHYNYDQSMVVGFKCQPQPDIDETYHSLICTDSYSMEFKKNFVNIKTATLYNMNFLTFYGSLGIYFEDEDGRPENSLLIPVGARGTTVTASLWGIEEIASSVLYNKVKPGKYTVYLASSALQDVIPQPIRCPGGPICYHIKIADDKTVEASEPELYTAGLSSPRMDSRREPWVYDLRGRRLGTSLDNLPKGIYIIGGKKIVK